VALFVRLAYLTFAHTYRVRSLGENFGFGFEAGRIARALIAGRGYSDPFSNIFVDRTGPTAWLPPLYPLLMAAVFKVCGVYTAASAWVILALNCVAGAATAPAVWKLGMRFAGRRNALWSAWLWALYPAAMQYDVRWLWETAITTCLFAWMLVLAMHLRVEAGEPGPARRWHWLGFGLLWGVIALSNSTLLIFLPAAGIWILLGSRKTEWRGDVISALLAAVVFAAVITPWTLRNWVVFHTLIPLRGNFGAEMYLGNGPGATGLLMEYDHPNQAPDQLRLYARMGEVAYVKMRGDAANAFIASDPGLFVTDIVKRVYFFWASVPHPESKPGVEVPRVLDFGFLSLAGLMGLGLALLRRKPFSGVWFWAFLLVPLPYYVVTVHARFRHPLEPLIAVLGVFLFQSAERRRSHWQGSPTARASAGSLPVS
jgi:4-amino-4-deoxy-L-arabinose transferase-like glycosyltransferase